MSVVTACLGRIIRDVVARVSLIMLRNELYVIAAFAGGLVFVGLIQVGMVQGWASLIASVTAFMLQGAGIRWKLSLPRHRS